MHELHMRRAGTGIFGDFGAASVSGLGEAVCIGMLLSLTTYVRVLPLRTDEPDVRVE